MRRSEAAEVSVLVLAATALLCFQTPLCGQPGDPFPTPPQQNAPWKPKSVSVPELASVTEVLFKQGLPDPRGCDYREIEPQGWEPRLTDDKTFRPHGWVLPAAEGQRHPYAICWDGLIYPVVQVGAKVDVRKDIEALLEADWKRIDENSAHHKAQEAKRAKLAAEDGRPFRRHPFSFRWGKVYYARRHDVMARFKAVLLLRLGHADLAEKLWKQWRFNKNVVHAADPYLELATDWVSGLYDRAYAAHMDGHDRLAVLTLRRIDRVRKAVEAQAERRGFEARVGADGIALPHLTLDGFAELLADQERRAGEPKREFALKVGLEKFADREKRVAALIRDLDQVKVRGQISGLGWPEPADFTQSPIYRALLKEGDAAVEPLLTCLEEDIRLTRSNFSDDIHPVGDVAYKALCDILKIDFKGHQKGDVHFFPEGLGARRQVAAEMREYWDKFKGLSEANRLYRTLADERAAPEAWLQAALNIVHSETAQKNMYERLAEVGREYDPGLFGLQEPKPLNVLRKETNPSVSELIAKRMMQVLDVHENKDGQPRWNVRAASALAHILVDWDDKPHLKELRKLTRALQERWALQVDRERACYHFLGGIMPLYTRRMKLGDEDAVREYVAWMKTIQPVWVGTRSAWIFQPMCQYPKHPVLTEAAEWAFTSEDSPWSRLIDSEGAPHAVNRLFESDLLLLPVFRQRLLDVLSDKTVVGKATVEEDAALLVHYLMGGRMAAGGYEYDALKPKPGTRVPVRKCDHLAWILSGIRGSPRCELYWPEAKRDEAVAEMATFLRKYGRRLGPGEDRWWPVALEVTFPKLGRPATPEDVKNADAIFTLAGGGKTRTFNIPVFPMIAIWTRLKDRPYEAKVYDDKGNETGTTVTKYHQDGKVWQAEEVLVDGKWERYCGFVSKYRMDRAPAAEIELPGEPRLANGLSCRVGMAGIDDYDKVVLPGGFKPGGLLLAQLWLSNISGVDRMVPTDYVRVGANGELALVAGLEVKLLYLPPETRDECFEDFCFVEDFETAFPDLKWQRLTPKVTAHFKTEGPGRKLLPADEFKAAEVNLSELFDTTRPGIYAFQFVFTQKNGGFTEGKSHSIAFRLPLPQTPR